MGPPGNISWDQPWHDFDNRLGDRCPPSPLEIWRLRGAVARKSLDQTCTELAPCQPAKGRKTICNLGNLLRKILQVQRVGNLFPELISFPGMMFLNQRNSCFSPRLRPKRAAFGRAGAKSKSRVKFYPTTRPKPKIKPHFGGPNIPKIRTFSKTLCVSTRRFQTYSYQITVGTPSCVAHANTGTPGVGFVSIPRELRNKYFMVGGAGTEMQPRLHVSRAGVPAWMLKPPDAV